MYDKGDKKRKEIGKKGMEWALGKEAGFTSEIMSSRVIDGMDELFDKFQPRPKFTFTSDKDQNNKVLNHKLVY